MIPTVSPVSVRHRTQIRNVASLMAATTPYIRDFTTRSQYTFGPPSPIFPISLFFPIPRLWQPSNLFAAPMTSGFWVLWCGCFFNSTYRRDHTLCLSLTDFTEQNASRAVVLYMQGFLLMAELTLHCVCVCVCMCMCSTRPPHLLGYPWTPAASVSRLL